MSTVPNAVIFNSLLKKYKISPKIVKNDIIKENARFIPPKQPNQQGSIEFNSFTSNETSIPHEKVHALLNKINNDGNSKEEEVVAQWLATQITENTPNKRFGQTNRIYNAKDAKKFLSNKTYQSLKRTDNTIETLEKEGIIIPTWLKQLFK
jgi:hypothetical protein